MCTADCNAPATGAATSDVAPEPIECVGVFHSTEMEGHSGPARFMVFACCPSCGWFDVAPMCAGHVDYVAARDGEFSCGTCGATFYWRVGWTLVPLEDGGGA